MKHIALIPAILFLVVALSSCCTSCFKGEKYGQACCEKDTFEDQVTEWVEEEVYYDNGAKGGKGGSTIVRRPVVKTVKKEVACSDCGSWYCATSACCDTVSKAVLKRATAQGGTGEPHMGQIPTMKILAP